jgi:hypothetical protein
MYFQGAPHGVAATREDAVNKHLLAFIEGDHSGRVGRPRRVVPFLLNSGDPPSISLVSPQENDEKLS